MDNFIYIPFSKYELKEIIADYYGYDKEDVNPNDYSETEISQIILDKIM